MNNKWDGKWIYFSEYGTSQSGITKIWSVQSKQGDQYLGDVRWCSSWRKYAFYPDPYNQTIYEATCLRDIADFTESETHAHRELRGRLEPEPPQTTYGLLAGRDLSK